MAIKRIDSDQVGEGVEVGVGVEEREEAVVEIEGRTLFLAVLRSRATPGLQGTPGLQATPGPIWQSP